MTHADLQKALGAVEKAAVLVSPRIIERVIREDYKLPNMYWNIPHWKSYVCGRQLLFRHAEQADLDLEPDQLLPDTVILLVRPGAEELSNLERQPMLLKYWRRLFHSRVHLALGELEAAGRLTDEAIRDRIQEIGQTEFEEIRKVLTEDHYLPPHADDRAVYVEFAAVYLEMRYFTANLLANYFPAIRDFTSIERLLGRDVDAAALFAETRLKGAPDPIVPRATRSEESQEAYWKLVRAAQSASVEGNTVRAAILRMRASRIAPAALTYQTRQEAEGDVEHLCGRLAKALGLADHERAEWVRYLKLLLERADQGQSPMEAQMLMELQKVCLDHEKEIYTLDLVEYLTSLGKRPIKRPLPSQRLVRIAKHLRTALQQLGQVRLADADRTQLARLIQQSLHTTEEALQARFRPVLQTALQDVGMMPATPLQRVAFDKMIVELLDHISMFGYLTFAELRDTISRNHFKLADLAKPEDFIGGDALIRLDKRLASLLDGVYRPSEFYVRWLERFTSLKFGTPMGRLVTLWFTLPFLFAYLILHVIGIVLDGLFNHERYPGVYQVTLALLGPVHDPKPGVEPPSILWHVGLVLFSGLLGVATLQSPAFRHRCRRAFLAVERSLRWLFVELPRKLLPVHLLERIYESWPFQLFYWYVFKPGVLAALLYWVWPVPWQNPLYAAVLFLLIVQAVNSRLGRRASEAISDGAAEVVTMIRAGLFLGVLRFILQVFKQIRDAVDYVLFTVDEWLRFRSGDSNFSFLLRTVAGVLWTPVAFVIRFYTVVLFEPYINPLKAPITAVAAKLSIPVLGLYPTYVPAWQANLIASLAEILSEPVAVFLVIGTSWVLPGAAAFFVWEMKENWSLYRANRSNTVRPASVGSHGETVRGLLQPGFHSGTIPVLYSKLRQAERRAAATRDWNPPRAYQRQLEEVSEGVRRLIEREMVACLRQARSWQGLLVDVGPIHLSTNRIRFELDHGGFPAQPVEVALEHHDRWILASVTDIGWLDELTEEQLRVFTSCLAYLYKRADVDLVREQVELGLDVPLLSLRIRDDELLVWTSDGKPPRAIKLKQDLAHPENNGELYRLVFGRIPLEWSRWVEGWERDRRGEGHPGLPGLGELLVVLPGRSLASGRIIVAAGDAPLPSVDGNGTGHQVAVGEEPRAGEEARHSP